MNAKFLLAFLVFVCCIQVNAQQSADTVSYLDMELEQLMNITIESASRKEEKAFDAPLSSYVITKKEILNAGITSIPEALRLCPGLFVKQMYNGVYDVSIRGLDNLPTHNTKNTSKTILVMINNRPVFDHYNGGTLWQNFPVDLVDVERIEVVAGPSSPLYGPNAVTGVINIITLNPDSHGLFATAHVQAGSLDTYLAQTFLAYRVSRKLAFSGSVNYQTRGRAKSEFFDAGHRDFITDFSQASVTNRHNPDWIKEVYPAPDRAIEKHGANVNINYSPVKGADFHLSGGFSKTQNLFGFSTQAPAITTTNDNRYGILTGEVKGFTFLSSVVSGSQRLSREVYDYTYFDEYLDYNIEVTDRFSLRPAVNFQQATISDTKYAETVLTRPFQGRFDMYNLGLSVKADYTVGAFRFIAALRGDKFKYPDDWYFSHQLIANYKVNDDHIFRFIVARSNGGSYMEDTYFNLINVTKPPTPSDPFTNQSRLRGNKDRKLVVNDLYEIGYRMQMGKKLQLDVAVFNQQADGYGLRVTQATVIDSANLTRVTPVVRQNLDVKAVQNGMTVSLNWIALDNKLTFRPFVTVQQTRMLNYSPYHIVPGDSGPSKDYNINTQQDVKSKATPAVYGGFYANYSATAKLNINVNGYYMDKYEILASTSASGPARPYEEFDISKMGNKFVLNARIGYQLSGNFNVFANVRNMLNNDGREFFATDAIGAMYLGGIHFTY